MRYQLMMIFIDRPPLHVSIECPEWILCVIIARGWLNQTTDASHVDIFDKDGTLIHRVNGL